MRLRSTPDYNQLLNGYISIGGEGGIDMAAVGGFEKYIKNDLSFKKPDENSDHVSKG